MASLDFAVCSVLSGFSSRLVDLGVVGNGALSVAWF